MIVWTTGTTGTPKGAWFDHESLRVIARGIGPLSAAGDRKLMPVPFAHTAYMTRIYDQLVHRYALILTPRAWTPRSMLDLIVTERVTVGQGVPAQWEKLLMLDELDAADLSCLRLVSTGASRVPPSLVRAMRKRLGCPVVVRYASTEVPLCFGHRSGRPGRGRRGHRRASAGRRRGRGPRRRRPNDAADPPSVASSCDRAGRCAATGGHRT